MSVHAVESRDPVERNIRDVARILLAWRHQNTEWLGKQLGVNRQTAFRRMNGTRAFLATEVARMAEVFGVPVSVFFEPPDNLFRGPVTPSSADQESFDYRVQRRLRLVTAA